jgi:hypothetical protein
MMTERMVQILANGTAASEHRKAKKAANPRYGSRDLHAIGKRRGKTFVQIL